MTKKLTQVYDDLSLFPLNEAYNAGKLIGQKIANELPVGRTIFGLEDAGILGQMIIHAKHSDHIEIGTFFGGSAILAALIKKEFGMHGQIHCVDPLEVRPTLLADGPVGKIATSDTLFGNAEYFGVSDRIVLHQHLSKPWPLDGSLRFGTGYIDGDHWHGMPAHDWNVLQGIVSYAIAFDDCAIAKPEVIDAVLEASRDPRWLLVRMSGLTAVLRRRQ